ncbi:MAG: hypothetical protein NC113_03320 [Bacteroides sp.]|nr:hypothetical protein [Bacteroides sp.]MCM1447242.1 hypothetical protein [Bacteroides sp.]
MKHTHTYRPAVFRFRRWSRKGYAVFSSLGKLVTIGRGCKSIADASLRKSGMMPISSCMICGERCVEDENCPPGDTLDSQLPCSLSVVMASGVLVVPCHNCEAASCAPCSSVVLPEEGDNTYGFFTTAMHTARMMPMKIEGRHPRCLYFCLCAPRPEMIFSNTCLLA